MQTLAKSAGRAVTLFSQVGVQKADAYTCPISFVLMTSASAFRAAVGRSAVMEDDSAELKWFIDTFHIRHPKNSDFLKVRSPPLQHSAVR